MEFISGSPSQQNSLPEIDPPPQKHTGSANEAPLSGESTMRGVLAVKPAGSETNPVRFSVSRSEGKQSNTNKETLSGHHGQLEKSDCPKEDYNYSNAESGTGRMFGCGGYGDAYETSMECQISSVDSRLSSPKFSHIPTE
jgi:hypothetical protein